MVAYAYAYALKGLKWHSDDMLLQTDNVQLFIISYEIWKSCLR